MIRRATPADFAAIQALRQQLFSLLAGWMPETFRAMPYPDGYLQEVLDDERQALLVAEQNGHVVAYALVQDQEADSLKDPTLVPMRYTYLLDFSVDPACQGQGIGQRLHEAVIAYAKSCGSSCIELSVVAANGPAIAFYKKHGYETTIHRMRCPLEQKE